MFQRAARLAIPLLSLLTGLPVAAQELRGHGGPVRALAVSADGAFAMSGSFDQSAILWRLGEGVAGAVLRFHEGAVNAVVALPGGGFATGGEDGHIALWAADGLATGAMPRRVIVGHAGGISALAASADGRILASASWDGTARLTTVATGMHIVLAGHAGPLSGIAFLPEGSPHGLVATTGHDATLRIWSPEGMARRVIQLDVPQNGVAVAGDGEIVTAGADGYLRFFASDGALRARLEIAPVPLVALALSPDGRDVAAGGLRGQTVLLDRPSRKVRAVLVGPGLPVWSMVFTPDGRELLTGGSDRLVRRWNAATGEHVGQVVPRAGQAMSEAMNAVAGSERGAQVFRACAACHTLGPQDGNRAGPSLHGVIGRRIATAPGYAYSPALKGMDIVWTRETIARLFEIGPTAYTPGTKMPEQKITSPEDREALVEWLEKVTR